MSTKVKERPILFSGPMVRAILDGRKTQTRRAVNLSQFDRSDTPGYDWHFRGTAKGTKRSSLWQDLRHDQLLGICPYGKPGERLWVRETWAPMCDFDPEFGVIFRADQYPSDKRVDFRWTPSIYMPRWASRITLEIVSVRVERLNDISEVDAIAEGIYKFQWPLIFGYDPKGTPGPLVGATATEAYALLWEHINGEGSWAANPWVWVVELKRLESTP